MWCVVQGLELGNQVALKNVPVCAGQRALQSCDGVLQPLVDAIALGLLVLHCWSVQWKQMTLWSAKLSGG